MFCRTTQGLQARAAGRCIDVRGRRVCACHTPGYRAASPSVPLCVADGASGVLVSFTVLYAAATLSQWTEGDGG